jgi:hypothetical protein
MNVEAVLARLQGVRRNGEQWVARCPAHADKSPSLSVRNGDGKVLLHCFAGCKVEAICAAASIEVRDLFSKPCASYKPEPRVVRDAQKQLSGFRSQLTPRDRERAVTVILANETNLDAAIARALALAVEGDLVQVAFDREAQ